jgi:hypothetical protein
MTRLGLDVDGVLADFNHGFLPILEGVSGRKLVADDYEPEVWYWPQHIGYTPDEESAAWSAVISVTSFWTTLAPLPGAAAFLGRLQYWAHAKSDREVYFVTARPGKYAKQQTEWWLRRFGITNPSVIVSSEKSLVSNALRFSHYVDDCFENFLEWDVRAPHCRAMLRAARWNRSPLSASPTPINLTVIESLEDIWSTLP